VKLEEVGLAIRYALISPTPVDESILELNAAASSKEGRQKTSSRSPLPRQEDRHSDRRITAV